MSSTFCLIRNVLTQQHVQKKNIFSLSVGGMDQDSTAHRSARFLSESREREAAQRSVLTDRVSSD